MKRKRVERTNWAFLIIGAVVVAVGGIPLARQAYWSVKTSAPEWKSRRIADFPGIESASALPLALREWIIETVNAERCACDCGFTLATCLKNDSDCPLRAKNLERVKELVRQARARSR